MTTEKRTQEHRVEIDAPAEVVWRAITEADELTRWYVEDARVRPGEGGTQWVSWGGGVEMETTHLAWTPGEHLRLGTPGGENKGGWDALILDFTIESSGEKTVLRLVQSGMSDEEGWDDAYDSTEVGWRQFLAALRFYLERHRGEPRRTLYRYGTIQLPKPDAWEKVLRTLAPGGELAGLAAGDRYTAAGPGGDSLSGDVLLYDPGRNFMATVEGYGDALLSFDLGGTGKSCFMNFILGTYGPARERVDALRRKWEPVLDEIVPRATVS